MFMSINNVKPGSWFDVSCAEELADTHSDPNGQPTYRVYVLKAREREYPPNSGCIVWEMLTDSPYSADMTLRYNDWATVVELEDKYEGAPVYTPTTGSR